MENLANYYLDLTKIIDLPSPKRNLIMELYRDMLHYNRDKSYEQAVSYFNSLEMGGYLKNRLIIDREKKLYEIVDE